MLGYGTVKLRLPNAPASRSPHLTRRTFRKKKVRSGTKEGEQKNGRAQFERVAG